MSNSGWSVGAKGKEIGSHTIKNKTLNILLGSVLLPLLVAVSFPVWGLLDLILKSSGRKGFIRKCNLLDPEDNHIVFDADSFRHK